MDYVEIQPNPEKTRNRILDVLSRAQDILTLPTIVQEVVEITHNKRASAKALTKIIENDPALPSKILSVANSPYYGFIKKVSTVAHAVVVLGFREIQNIALGMSVGKMFGRRGTEFTEKLWSHSFSAGVATRMLASFFNLKLDGKYFVGGLLHDIGKIFLCQYVPDVFDYMLATLYDRDNILSYHALERDFCGITHAEIGGRLLNSWMFPQEITNAVASHHGPRGQGDDEEMVALVHLADIICTIKGISPTREYSFLPIDRSMLPVLNKLRKDFCTQDIQNLMAQLDLEIEKQSSFLQAFK